MLSRGIFQKTCPACATQVPTDALNCDCGFSFRNDDVESSGEGGQAQQELMYEYVKARMAQALETLKSLHNELLTDPKNFEKANRLMKAYADVRELRAEMREFSPSSETDVIDAAAKALAQAPMTTQPPQAFRAGALRDAHRTEQVDTDDAALVEAAGGTVVVVAGERRNLKLTMPDDLELAQALIEGART